MPKRLSVQMSLVLVSLFSFFVFSTAYAMSPSLGLTLTGDGDSVQVNVTGDPSTNAFLFYYKTGSGLQVADLGNTDSNGNLSTTVSSSADGIISGSPVHVATGGINGQQSSTVTWPTVTIAGTTVTNGTVTFDQGAPILSVGQTSAINLYGPTGSLYYVSSNSSSSVVQTSVSGSTLTLTALTSGSASITVCSSLGGCGTLNATVNYAANGGAVVLSQTNLALLAGQTINISASGGTAPYTIINGSTSVANAYVNGNLVSISGVNVGSTTVNVCSSTGGCTPLYVTVNTANSMTYTQTGGVLSYLHDSVGYGTPLAFTLSPSGFTSPTYSLTDSFPGSSVSAADINVSGYFSWIPQAGDVGSHMIMITATDSYGHNDHFSMFVVVTTAQTVSAPTGTTTSTSTPVKYIFSVPLASGDVGVGVIALQLRLTQDGVYNGPVNGHYGPLTESAVKAYQAKYGLEQLGVVGPGTRAQLNK